MRHRGRLPLRSSAGNPTAILQSKILFEPPLLAQLAEEAGIELGVLDLLQQLGVTSESELRKLPRRERTNPDSR